LRCGWSRAASSRSQVEEGIDLATLAKILGHNSIRIVERYVHPTAEHTKSAMLRYQAAQMARAQTAQAERLN
jgi:site-specific recombinase XerD